MRISKPKHLSRTAGKFYTDVFKEFELEPHHLKILTAACECLDRMQDAREQIKKDGLFVKDRYGQVKAHPAQKVEIDNKTLFARLIRELGLDIEGPEESRLPRIGG